MKSCKIIKWVELGALTVYVSSLYVLVLIFPTPRNIILHIFGGLIGFILIDKWYKKHRGQ